MWSRSGRLLRSVPLRPRIGAERQVRWLNLQEYQSKHLLREEGVNVQPFFVVNSAQETVTKLKDFQKDEYVVKAQILAGGRGKGTLSSGMKGGVKLTKNVKEVVEFVENMVGHRLVTKQTPKEGVLVKKVMVAESVEILKEAYLAILLDRDSGGPVLVASPAGGMDIEEVAEKTPHLIFKVPIDINKGLDDATALDLAKKLEVSERLQSQCATQIKRLYKLFLKVDATQIEINPLSETGCDHVYCIDAKLNFDDNAEFRQKEIFAMDDKEEQDPREVEAEKSGLNYVGMDGNIACLVNGAGLAMATMDIIKLHGGEPANFLDCGGGVTEGQVTEAFRIITTDPNVKAILVNVFGGIVNCNTIALGLTAAFRKLDLSVPLVVRLEGTNVEVARQTLKESNLPIITATDLDDAAEKAVSCIRST